MVETERVFCTRTLLVTSLYTNPTCPFRAQSGNYDGRPLESHPTVIYEAVLEFQAGSRCAG